MATPIRQITHDKLHPTLVALSDAGATIEDADWIRKPGNAALLVRFIRDSRAEVERSIGSTITIPVSYQLPFHEELHGTVFDWASSLFSNTYTWEEHESVRGLVDRTPGDRDFLVKHFTEEEIREMDGLTSEHVIAWADKNGYRASVLEETVDFAKAQPDLQRQFPIVALGSFAVYRASRVVAILRGNDARRGLDDGWFDYRWDADSHFLLVRK
ncbi:hypothetical protein GF380_04675 [Candidatus Uhrbacteria bacterium]|nr:hypothetical protein [Candidatus Uhrbacteria bacterium]MBD3284350.1 hypothetical protein [Candidatus Uhrbacteria bacterium]